MPRIQTWELSYGFWNLVEPLIPPIPRVDGKPYIRNPGGGRKPNYSNRLSLVVTGANRHDSVALDPLLRGRVVEPTSDPEARRL